MNASFRLALLGALTVALCFSPPVTAEPALASVRIDNDKEALEAALGSLKRVAGRDDLDDRKAALEDLVKLNNPDALGPLLSRLVIAASLAGSAEQELSEGQILIERKRVQLAEVELAFERNSKLKGDVSRLRRELQQLETEMVLSQSRSELEGPWRDTLRKGLNRLLVGQGASKRRTLTKSLWKTFEKGEEPTSRLASAWLLADLGEAGSASRFARVMISVLNDRIKLRKGSAELEKTVHEWERRMQEEIDKFGNMTNGTFAAYNRARTEAGNLNRDLLVLERLARSLSISAGRTLSNDPAAAEGITDLIRLARKSAHQALLIEVLVQSGRDEAKAAMAAELSIAKGDLFKRILVNGLSTMGAKVEAEPWLLASGLQAESWLLRSHSIEALANLRSRDAVPLLIEMLGKEEGRLRTDIGTALTSLTGMDFNGNLVLWQRWWKDNQTSFEVPAIPPATGEIKALESVGMTFFGLRTESRKVLFVLDVSGSMDFLMKNTTSGPKGEKRITVAKRELLRALGGIPNGGTFNIVLYASDVWVWSEDPVVMDDKSRTEVTEFVNGIKPNGGTNVFGSMKLALGRARGKAKKKKARSAPKWTPPVYDTVFLLSDGQPSVGISIERDDILDMVAEENSDLGVQINTIGLSTDQDAVLMRRLAEQSGGKYVAR